MVNAKSRKTGILKKLSAAAMAAIIGVSTATSAGVMPWSESAIIKADEGVYYDVGTFSYNKNNKSAINWTSTATDSVTAHGKKMTVPDTSTTAALVMTTDDTDVNAKSGTYSYIAKGTEKTDTDGKLYVEWTIRAWPQGQNDVVDFTRQSDIKAVWGGSSDPYDGAAPDWTTYVWGGGSATNALSNLSNGWLEIVTQPVDHKGATVTSTSTHSYKYGDAVGSDDARFAGYVLSHTDSSLLSNGTIVQKHNDTVDNLFPDAPAANSMLPLFETRKTDDKDYDSMFRALNSEAYMDLYKTNLYPTAYAVQPDANGNPYRYTVEQTQGSALKYCTSYPVYSVEDYISYYWGQVALPSFATANPDITGFKLVETRADINPMIDTMRVPTAAYHRVANSGTYQSYETSRWVFGYQGYSAFEPMNASETIKWYDDTSIGETNGSSITPSTTLFTKQALYELEGFADVLTGSSYWPSADYSYGSVSGWDTSVNGYAGGSSSGSTTHAGVTSSYVNYASKYEYRLTSPSYATRFISQNKGTSETTPTVNNSLRKAVLDSIQGQDTYKTSITNFGIGDDYIAKSQFPAAYSEKTNADGTPAFTNIRDASMSQKLQEVTLNYTSAGVPKSAKVTNTRMKFDIDFKAKYATSTDFARLSTTLDSNPLGDSPAPVRTEVITSTSAKNADTTAADRTKVVASATSKIVDTITYTGFIANNAYTITTSVVDKANPTTVLATKTTAFAPTTAAGTTDVTITVDTSAYAGKNVVVFEDVKDDATNTSVASHKDANDAAQTVAVIAGTTPVIDLPSITATVASSATGAKTVACGAGTIIKDTISYAYLTPNTTYNILTTVVDKANPATPIINKQATAFTPTTANGTTSITVTLDTTNYANKNLVFYEYIQLGTNIAAAHEDLTDADQTVAVMSSTPIPVPATGTIVSTAASDPTSGTSTISCGANAQLRDAVIYKDLTIGETYTLITSVVDKASGAFVLTNHESTFTATAASGTYPIIVTLNTTNYKGKSLVVYEVLKSGATVLSEHADINDVNQTVTVKDEGGDTPTDDPDGNIISTVATSATGTKTIAKGANTEIKDTISYKGFKAGTTYNVTTLAVDRATGTTLATVNSTFTATAATGVAAASLTLDTSALGGKQIVIYEYIYEGTTLVGRHAVLTDDNQTVTVDGNAGGDPTPDDNIASTVATSATGTKTIESANNVTIKDTINYKNLTAGKTYTVRTMAINKTTATSIKSVDSTFTASAAAGSTTVTITVNTLALANGDKIVIYEYIYDGATLVGRHAVLTDVNQTVTVEGSTTNGTITSTYASSESGTKYVPCSSTAVIRDVVNYTGLTAGQTYTLVSSVVDRSTGSLVGSAITSSFTPASTAGSHVVSIPVNTLTLTGRSLVVYETLKIGNTVVDVHNDITDANQTVTVGNGIYDLVPMVVSTVATNGTISNSAFAFSIVKTVPADAKAVITDRIYYRDLVDGQVYIATPTVYVKGTNEEVVTNKPSVQFTANNMLGYVDVQISFDATKYAGKDIVIFESISAARSFDAVRYELIDEGDTYISYNAQYIAWVRKVQQFITDFNINDATLSTYVNSALYNSSISFSYRDGILGLLAGLRGSGTKNVEVCYHRDMNDPQQTLTISGDASSTSWVEGSITQTIASNGVNGKTIAASSSSVIFDKVSYYRLTAGKTYTLQSSVYDKTSGQLIVSNYTSYFVASDLKTEYDVVIPVNTVGLEGHQLVVFETIYSGSTKICAHDDVNDASQTVTVESKQPETTKPTDTTPVDTTTVITIPVDEDTTTRPTVGTLGSVAVDSVNRSHTMSYSTNASIEHTVTYNIPAGKTSVLVSTVYDKTTGEQIIGGIQKTFVSEGSGSVSNIIPINTLNYPGRTLMVYGTITQDGQTVAEFKDPNNRNSQVAVAGITTILTAENTTSKTVPVGTNVKVVDTVRYTGLTPGKTYVITGHILNRELSADIDYNKVDDVSLASSGLIIEGDEGSLVTNGARVIATKTITFTPEAESGFVNVDFLVNTQGCAGQHLVAFETITEKEHSTVVATEKDLNDQNQTALVKFSTNVYTGGEDMTSTFAFGSIACGIVAIALVAVLIARKRKFSGR